MPSFHQLQRFAPASRSNQPANHSPQSRPLLGFIGACLLGLSSVQAETVLWIRPASAGAGNWNAAVNWSPTAPVAGDTAIIANSVAFVEGATKASALNLGILSGAVTIGDFDPGTLQVDNIISIGGGRLNLNYGALSFNGLELSTQGGFSDTKAGSITLTGANPTVRLAPVNLVFNSQVAGTTGLNLTGPGTLVLAGNNTYSGKTSIAAGSTLQIGSGGTSGNLGAGNVVNQGQLVFSRGDSSIADQVISGAGSVLKTGGGALIMTGDNTYQGGATINGGTLQVGNGGTSGSLGSGAIVNNGTLAFKRSDAILLKNGISGSGSLAQTGTGTLVITAENTYTGTTTILSGTLQVGDGGTSGSLGSGSIANQGILAFKRSDDISLGNAVSGTGTLVQAGSGRLTVTSNNTYSGGTLIESGTVQVGNGSASGTLGSGPVLNKGSVVLQRNEALVMANPISGIGSLRQSGSGTLVLTGANTYTGTTTIDAETTLQVGNAGNSGTLGSGSVELTGTLAFARNDTIVVDNVVHGAGNLRQIGNGTLVFTADNDYTGGTSILSGTVQVGNGGSSGSLGSGPISNQSRIVFNRSQELKLDSSISGTGAIVQSGSGTLVLTADQSYSGTTTIASGSTLQVGAGAKSGSLGSSDVINAGTLVFDRSDAIVLSQNVTGSGSLRQAGSGTLTVTSNLGLTGGVTVASGTLRVGDGGTTGSLGSGPIVNDGRLVFERSDALVLDRVISGKGLLRHSGSGTLTLAAAHTYTGGTFVDGGGSLRVVTPSGLGAGDVTVSRGQLVVDSSQSPNRIKVAVSGNYAQAAGTVLELGFSGGAVPAVDTVAVAGRATLNGTLRLVPVGDFRPTHYSQFQLLSAGSGVSGRFTSFESSLSASPLLQQQLTYAANDVTLSWKQLSFQPYASSANQSVLASTLDTLAASSHETDRALIEHLDYSYVTDLTNGLRGALDQLSPEGLTSLLTVPLSLTEQRADQFLRRAGELRADHRQLYKTALRDRAASASAFDEYIDNPLALYLELPLQSYTVKNDAVARGYDTDIRGVTIGADRRVGETSFIGVAGHYRSATSDLNGGGQLDTTHAGADVYAVIMRDGWHFDGMLGAGKSSFDTRRTSVGGDAEGSTNGWNWTGLGGVGYDWQSGPLRVGTIAAAQFYSSEFDAFAEQGSLAPLAVAAQRTTGWNSQLGLSLRYSLHLGAWTFVTPDLYVGWRHDFSDERRHIDARFASTPDSNFRVHGASFGGDGVIGRAGLTIQWRPAVQTSVSYTRQFGREGQEGDQLVFTGRLSF